MVIIMFLVGIIIVFIVGYVKINQKYSRIIEKIEFTREYRHKFIAFVNKYFETYNTWENEGELDKKLYIWLTMNVSKMQGILGYHGIVTLQRPLFNYVASNYQIVINTLPKFRGNSVESAEVSMVDDCLLQYIGFLEEVQKDAIKECRNPIIWFREGFRGILSVPIAILNWFGIISEVTVNSITNSLLYKVISGLIALVTLISGIVTIIVGYEDTIKMLKRIFAN